MFNVSITWHKKTYKFDIKPLRLRGLVLFLISPFAAVSALLAFMYIGLFELLTGEEFEL